PASCRWCGDAGIDGRGFPAISGTGFPCHLREARGREEMDGGGEIEVSVLGGLDAVAPEEWDACAGDACGVKTVRPVDPFTTWRFLGALEESGSVGRGTGWMPRHLVAREDGLAIGVMP